MADGGPIRVYKDDGRSILVERDALGTAIIKGWKPHPQQKGEVPRLTAAEIYAGISRAQQEQSQRELYKTFGPEAEKERGAAGESYLRRLPHQAKSLYHEATSVLSDLYGALIDPKQAAIMGTGLLDPAIPAAYYGTQATAGLAGIDQPSSVRGTVKGSPGAARSALLQLSTLAGAGTAVKAPSAGVLPRKIAAGTRIAGQEIMGAGRGPVLEARLKRAAEVTKKQQAYETRLATRESEAAGREAAVAVRDRLSKEATDSIVAAENAERRSLDARGDALREGTGPVAAAPTVAALAEGREMLVGDPPSLKLFNDLTKQLTEEAEALDVAGGLERVPKEDIPFNEARIHYTALGEVMMKDIPWNVRKAVELVRGTLDGGIENAIAASRGEAGVAEYRSWKSDWNDYAMTWRDMRPISRGGSPLARIIDRAKAPLARKGEPFHKDVGKILLSSAGERIPYLLARKMSFGADPTVVTRLREASERLPPSTSLKPVRPPTMPAETDPVALRRRILLRQEGRPFRWWELPFLFYGIEHLLLKSPKFRESLARQPRTEWPLPTGGW